MTDTGCCNASFGKTGKKMSARPSCVICYGEGKTQVKKNLKPGINYKKCMVLVESPDNPLQVEPISDVNQVICGVIMCHRDLSDTPKGTICPQKILACAEFDIDLVVLPDTFTEEEKELIMSTNKMCPCFSRRVPALH